MSETSLQQVTVGGLGQVHLTVSDIDVSVAFYRDVLGLPFLFDVPAQSMAFFDLGGARLYLAETQDQAFRSRAILYYRVDDLDRAFEAITGRGAVPMSPPQFVHRGADSELWIAFVADPDGPPVGLMTEKPLTGA